MNEPPRTDAVAGDDGDAVFGSVVRRLGRDLTRYLPAVAIPAVVSLLYVTLFTRVFEPDEFGRYAVVFATCTILIQLFGGWMRQSVSRYLPRYRAESRVDEFVVMLLAMVALLVGMVALLAVALYPVLHPRLGVFAPYYVPAAVLVVAGVAFRVLKVVFAANLQSGVFARFEILYALGRIAFALGFVYLVSRTAVGLIAGPAVAYVVVLPVLLRRQRVVSAVRRHPGAFRLTLFPTFLRYGLPMLGWTVGVYIFDLSDRYVIEYLRGTAEVGIYAANYNLVSMGIAQVAGPMLLAAHPLIVNAWESGGRAHIQRIIRMFSRYYLLAAMPVAAFSMAFARDIANLVLGESFREGYGVIPVVMGALLLWNLGFYGHKAIKLLEKTTLMFGLVMVCAAVNVVLNLLVVPRFGYMGAAYSTLASAALYPALVFVATRRYLAWRLPWVSLLRVTGASVAAAAVALAATSPLDGPAPRLAVGVVVGAVAYVAGLAALRELEGYERRVIRKWFRRNAE